MHICKFIFETVLRVGREMATAVRDLRNAKNWRETIVDYLDDHRERHEIDSNISSDDYLKILDASCERAKTTIVNGKYHQIEFRRGRGMDPNVLDGDAGFLNSCPIIITPRWAAKIVFESSNETINAFEITLGHELTHKEEICALKGGLLGWCFFKTLNEVYADFGSAAKMKNKDRKALASACRYKRKFKIEEGQEDKWSDWHPSWQKREEYALNCDFNDALIERVAQDMPFNWFVLHCGCVEKAKEIYKEKYITLTPKIKKQEGDTD